jgi:hypothetical protein
MRVSRSSSAGSSGLSVGIPSATAELSTSGEPPTNDTRGASSNGPSYDGRGHPGGHWRGACDVELDDRHGCPMTPAQCRAARGLVNMSMAQLAAAAFVPILVIFDFEGAGESRNPRTLRRSGPRWSGPALNSSTGIVRAGGHGKGEGTLSKDATLFHLAPVLLSPGSVILPGNYGRIITAVGLSHPLWARENILESVRQAHYPAKPSRLNACFACPTEQIARSYRTLMAAKNASSAWQILYEVEKTDDRAADHRADFNAVQPLPRRPEDMTQIAHLYWSSSLWTTVAEHPGLRCEGIVTNSSLRILRQID